LSTFVSVGNATQPFSRLVDAVERYASTLPSPVLVQHGATPFRPVLCHAVPFVDMPAFEQRIAESTLVILHAGAGSLIHAVRAGKVPVVMPRRAHHGEHVDDHQVELARELGAAGKVVVAMEADDLPQAVRRALELQEGAVTNQASSTMLKLVEATLERYAAELPGRRTSRRSGLR
jgi:UDP-N-acetylglucosamine transferase subunit ALG13